MVSPQLELAIAFTRLPPAGTAIIFPGEGVAASAVYKHVWGRSAGPSEFPKFATLPGRQYVLSAPVVFGALMIAVCFAALGSAAVCGAKTNKNPATRCAACWRKEAIASIFSYYRRLRREDKWL